MKEHMAEVLKEVVLKGGVKHLSDVVLEMVLMVSGGVSILARDEINRRVSRDKTPRDQAMEALDLCSKAENFYPQNDEESPLLLRVLINKMENIAKPK